MAFLGDLLIVLDGADVGRSNEDIFAGSDVKVPEGTQTFTTIRETAAFSSIRTHDVRTAAYEQPTAQVVARSRTVALALNKAREAYEALFITNVAIAGTWYLWIAPEQPPFDMGKDATGRPRYGFNVRAMKRPS